MSLVRSLVREAVRFLAAAGHGGTAMAARFIRDFVGAAPLGQLAEDLKVQRTSAHTLRSPLFCCRVRVVTRAS